MLKLSAGPNGLAFDPALGNIPDLWFGPISPLHKAPWHGAADDLPIPAVERENNPNFPR